MTLQQAGQAAFTNLLNLAPYGEWRGSPMGLAGRDPIFFSQLETEQTAHPALARLAPDVCLHCHGVMGQRQFCLDQFEDDPKKGDEVCNNTDLLGLDQNSQPIVPRQLFSREQVKAIPFQATTAAAAEGREVRRPRPRRRFLHHLPSHRDRREGADRQHLHRRLQGRRGGRDSGSVRGAAAGADGSFAGGEAGRISAGALVQGLRQLPQRGAAGLRRRQALGRGRERKKPEIILEQATYPEWVFSDFRDGGPTPSSLPELPHGRQLSGYWPER